MLKEIPKSDVVIRPFKVYKEFPPFTETDKDEVDLKWGLSGSFGSFDANDANDIRGVIYRSIEAQFYRNSATASIMTEVGRRKSYSSTYERNLEEQFALFSIPQIYYGEGIKPGSLTLTTGSVTYTDDGFSNLIDSASNVKGNIFYDRGFVIATKDIQSGSSFTDYSLQFRSTKTIYENEIFISVLESEFNASTNPTSFLQGSTEYDVVTQNVQTKKYDGSIENTELKYYNLKFARVNPLFWEYDFSASVDPTGSYLAPYITTIGLYDNEMNMVAVAKLPQPIKSLPDYPLNFIIRFDS
jgi:hypothetical protein